MFCGVKAVCSLFEPLTLGGNGISHLQQVMEVSTCVLHSFDSLIAHFGLLHGGKSVRYVHFDVFIAIDYDVPSRSSF